MRKLYICDIDGTIANLEHRLHYIRFNASMHGFEKDFSPDWDAFHDHVLDDAPIWPIIYIIKALKQQAFADVWFFTGRMERCRDHTTKWLERYMWDDPIIEMRRQGDFRSDVEIKQEMLDSMLHMDRRRLVAVFDDRERIVQMWRSNGIQCLQVKDGDY